MNARLNKEVNGEGRIHITPSKVKDTFFLRFAVCATRTESSDIQYAWDVIVQVYERIAADLVGQNCIG